MSQWTLLGIGAITSLGVGALACFLFDKFARAWLDAPEPDTPRLRVPGWLTGTIERIFFTTLVAFDISGYPTAMIGWLVAKMAVTWTGRGTPKTDAEADANRADDYRISNLITLLNGLVSMTFALIGGLIIQYALSPEESSDQRASFTSTAPAERSHIDTPDLSVLVICGIANKQSCAEGIKLWQNGDSNAHQDPLYRLGG
jgi:hypothetical protein